MIVASVLLALLVSGSFVLLLISIRDVRADERRSVTSQKVLVAANELERLLLDLETGQRGFLLTRQERFLEPWNQARRAFPRRAATLLTLVAGKPATRREASQIAQRERAYIRDYAVPLVSAARRGDPSTRSVAAAVAGKRRIDAMRRDFDRLLSVESGTAARSQASVDSAARRASFAAAAGVGGSIILIALYAGYLTRAIVRPVRRAAQMAVRLAGGDLGARLPEMGAGEIGTLERSFNVMGASLEQNRIELSALAEEQAGLRRVATLVAQGASPAEVFEAVAVEAMRLLDLPLVTLTRFEPDGTATVIAAPEASPFPVGTNLPLDGPSVSARVRATGRAAMIDDYDGLSGTVAAGVRAAGMDFAFGCPIIVDGRTWGALIAMPPKGISLRAEDEARLQAFTELVATAISNAEAQANLTESRARIVATADETRRRIERDLHDGAQQHLVSLVLQLRTAQAAMPPGMSELQEELDRVAAGLTGAQDALREYARGIHPAILAEGGLGPALSTLARRSTVHVDLDVRADTRLPERVEVGAYYVVSEALANAAKHAKASRVAVEVEAADSALRVCVRDDGIGGADFTRGSGLVGLKDRVEALGGRISIKSLPGEGTTIAAELPLAEARAVGSR
jgi:signal transduction histidine kinase